MIFANIDTSAYGEKETLFFIRIKGKKHFFDRIYGKRVMDRLFGHICNHRTISEYHNADHYIDLNKNKLSDCRPEDYKVYYACIHNDLSSIIARCRGLRSIPFNEAKTLVFVSCKYFYDFFMSQSYRLVVLHAIDSYVLDIMCRVAKHLDIKVLCLTEWFIKNYRRHTLYGETYDYREPTEEEILKVEKHFSSKKKAFWIHSLGRKNCLRFAVYLLLRYWILYADRYLFRHKLLGDNAYEYRFARNWKMGIRYFFVNRFFDKINKNFVLENIDRLIVVPLHTFPEANVDYWMADYRHADYYSSMFEAISYFRSKKIIMLLKEHPGFLYQRDPTIYRQLKQFENVRLVDPFSEAALLLNLIPVVLVWHGTMGIEALMEGKKVIAFDSNYYSKGIIPAYRDFESARPINDFQKRELIRKLLSGVQEI